MKNTPKAQTYDIEFIMEEPTIYVDSLVTL